MFGLFKTKKEINIKDLVWKNDIVKYNALAKHIQKQGKFLLIYYFEDTKQSIETILSTEGIKFSPDTFSDSSILLMKAGSVLNIVSLDNREVIFAEHHPSFSEEQSITTHLSEQLAATQLTFYISFEDELLKLFGASRILEMMNKLGYKDDEIIEHQMVSKSIQNAQHKIDKQVQFLSTSRNRKDWFEMNLPKM